MTQTKDAPMTDLHDVMRAELGGYNLPGFITDKAVQAAKRWADEAAVHGDAETRVEVQVPNDAGIGTRESAERRAVADLWVRCAEDGVAPTHRPVVEWQQVWDPSDPARPRLMAMRVTASCRVRTLGPAPEPDLQVEVEG